jgi:hypothetical protein
MSNLIVGAHAVLYINGTPYAYVSNLNPTISSPQKLLRGIDYLPPLDAAPGPLEYTVAAQIYRHRGNVGLEGDGLLPTWDKATRGKYFSAIIMDRITETVMFESQRSLVTSQSWNIGRGFVVGSVNWTGLGYSNDSDTLFS